MKTNRLAMMAAVALAGAALPMGGRIAFRKMASESAQVPASMLDTVPSAHSYPKRSGRTVAQDKRDARKARNRMRSK